MQLSFFMLSGDIFWKNKWSWTATFVTKSLEIPLLHFESSWDTLIFSHFLDVVINQGSSLQPCDSCLICINKYQEVMSTSFSLFLNKKLKQVAWHSSYLEVKYTTLNLILFSVLLNFLNNKIKSSNKFHGIPLHEKYSSSIFTYLFFLLSQFKSRI